MFVRPYLNCLASDSDKLVDIVKSDYLVSWNGEEYDFSVPVSELDVTTLEACTDQVQFTFLKCTISYYSKQVETREDQIHARQCKSFMIIVIFLFHF